ncbi:hypothetical protein KEM55_003396 [Ascosphaera atra]|nr:hypothetical protein KEM55_003396 [Ascosphaera atra]
MALSSPFADPPIPPGHGTVVLSLLPPCLPTLSTLSYRYPLKLLTRTPAVTLKSAYPSTATTPVHLYLLTYGGGLLPGDHIYVNVEVQRGTRLVVTTPQGCQKIYKTEGQKKGLPAVVTTKREYADDDDAQKSKQTLDVHIAPSAALCYLPDPTVPFEDSRYEQLQRFTIVRDSLSDDEISPSLCVLDWVTQGRGARGENWSFDSWVGRNEVWAENKQTEQGKGKGKRRLLVRDNVVLKQETEEGNLEGNNRVSGPISLAERTHPHGIVGTLILHGPLFASLSDFFMAEFQSQPRIGGRNWSRTSQPQAQNPQPSTEDVVWTAARVRNEFVLVKFGAKDFESAREWLGGLVRREGSIGREFGEEAYGCL